MVKFNGCVTIPTDRDVVEQTLEIMKLWGGDAFSDCDGTEFPPELKSTDAKIYATYYTTRKDNEWAKAHPDEIQQMYIMSNFYTATGDTLTVHLMDNLYPEMLKVNSHDDIFRMLYENVKGTTPYCVKKVAVLNCFGKMRVWGDHMVHHALYQKQNYSYAGVIEALSGAPYDVVFISFDDVRENPSVLDDVDVILNIGDAYTSYSGGENWIDEKIVTRIKKFIYNGGGFIGIGEPTACQHQGHFFQLAVAMGVEQEKGFDLNKDKYNWDEAENHFVTADCKGEIDFGEGKKNVFAFEGTNILVQRDKEVQLAVKRFRKRQVRVYKRTSVQL